MFYDAVGLIRRHCLGTQNASRVDWPDLHARELANPSGDRMLKIAVLCCGITAIGFDLAHAQDIAGIEDCTKTSGLEKRTGCLQSNVNFLQRLVTKNSLEARQSLSAIQSEVLALKSMVTSLQASVERLQAAQKGSTDKKPEIK
jgi:hypothetical protein